VRLLPKVGLEETDDEHGHKSDDGDQKQRTFDKHSKWSVLPSGLMRHSPFLTLEAWLLSQA